MVLTVTLNPSLDEWMSLDALRVGTLHRATGFARYPGGKGINVSRVVHELGGRTTALALTAGADGALLQSLLARLAIPLTCVKIAGATRNNYKIRTSHPRALTEINTEGPSVSASALRLMERRVLGHRPRPACVVLSGSLPPGAPATIYRRWIGTLQRRGIPCVLDASGAALRWGLGAQPWLVKPNRQEAEELLGVTIRGMPEAIEAARAVTRRGAEVAILSLGKRGAVMAVRNAVPREASLVTRRGLTLHEGRATRDASRSCGEVWVAISPNVTVDSAVGAGDSLVGGFVAGWVAGRSLPQALRLGVACGAATALTPGTELCHRADIARLEPRVKVHPLI